MTSAVPPEKALLQADSVKLKRRLPMTGIMLGLFVVGLATAMLFAGFDEIMSALSALSVGGLLLLCGLAACHYCLRATRWHILARIGAPETVLFNNVIQFFGGFAMTATPGRVGELVRLRWLQRSTGRGWGSLVPIPFADRAIELAAMVALAAVGLMATTLGSNAAWVLLAAGTALVWVTCQPRILETALVAVWRATGRRQPRLFVRLRRIIRKLHPFMKIRVLGPTLLIGIVGWSFEAVAFWLLLGWLGVDDMGLATAGVIFMLALLAGGLSGLPGGLGGTEATAVGLLILQGVPADTAILATAIIRITTLWFAIAIGLAVFPLAEMRSARSVGA